MLENFQYDFKALALTEINKSARKIKSRVNTQSAGGPGGNQGRRIRRLDSKSEHVIAQKNRSNAGNSPGKFSGEGDSVDREYKRNQANLR